MEQLQRLDVEGGNIIGLPDPVMAYVEWVGKVEGFLRALYADGEPAQRLLSRRYWGLAENSAPAYMYKHLTMEIGVQREYLRGIAEELQALLKIGEGRQTCRP
ncbi:hypothetical protein [Streptomyces sp. PKU-EA00015]|uniref:hypothetical protein n=1 Tax=Streptomyces sp. PKU-EA00015 TaxID=2748326 RepID=UPI001C435F64|nr:hypothetical protein [Streptomyces sp. PKU-EA00015]